MSGAGRTGSFLAAEHWNDANPDLIVLAKGLCAGYSPLGAVISPNYIVEKVARDGGFLHGHTYASNPLSCAIAEAVLSEVSEKGLILNAKNVGAYLKSGLEKLAQNSHIVGDVRGTGLLLAVEIVSDKSTKEVFDKKYRAVYRLAEIGMKKGILIYTRKTANGIFGEWLMISPPLISTIKETDLLLELLAETITTFEKETGLY
jgi:adenosylmethionine-8-amino-7-oxononanoate aminotransferase